MNPDKPRVYRHAPGLWCVLIWRQGDRSGRNYSGTWEKALARANWWAEQMRATPGVPATPAVCRMNSRPDVVQQLGAFT